MSQPARFERAKNIVDEMSWMVADSVADIARDSGAEGQRSMTIPVKVVELLFENTDDPDMELFAKASRVPAVAARVATLATAKLQMRAEVILQMYRNGPMTNQELVAIFTDTEEKK